jgi:hypothetical protein
MPESISHSDGYWITTYTEADVVKGILVLGFVIYQFKVWRAN